MQSYCPQDPRSVQALVALASLDLNRDSAGVVDLAVQHLKRAIALETGSSPLITDSGDSKEEDAVVALSLSQPVSPWILNQLCNHLFWKHR